MVVRRHISYRPLSVEEMLLLKLNPTKFISEHPERVIVKMRKKLDGTYEATTIAVEVR